VALSYAVVTQRRAHQKTYPVLSPVCTDIGRWTD